MSRERGLTLIEVVVALLVAAAMILGLGRLGLSTAHERVTNGMRSAAVHVAQRRMEAIFALAQPASDPLLAAGTRGPFLVDESGQVSIGGPYRETWIVVDDQPTTGSKRVTVRVTHVTDPAIRCEIETYLKTS